MKQKLISFIFLRRWKIKSILKVGWLTLFLCAPFALVYANDSSEGANSQEVKHRERLHVDATQQRKTVSGTVVDETGATMPGVTVIVKGTTNGTITNFDGEFSIEVEKEEDILVFSFIGMSAQEVPVAGTNEITVTMTSSNEMLDDIVVVGYGVQKKESVVGAITHTTGEELEKAGGVSNVGEALQGRLPGVTVINSSGLPGQTDPKIYIRGSATWNGDGQPLILVDGVQRSMSDLDMNEIENISVLKDASATAVFGVEGANGVILITTKRGKVGKAQLSLSGNVTRKSVSKLPTLLDSYDAIAHSNTALMKELMYAENMWPTITPDGIRDKYRYPATEEESYIYPNVDWQDVVLKDYAIDTRLNLSVRGGTEFAKYFGSLAYQTTRDIFKGGEEFENGKGYETPGFEYDRFNYRTNLDFNITRTTELSVNLSGYYGIQRMPTEDIKRALNPIYLMGPSLYTPVYPDGLYGLHPSENSGWVNPVIALSSAGSVTKDRLAINADFVLNQKLDFITKGLRFTGRFSNDSYFDGKSELKDSGNNSRENAYYRIYDSNFNEVIDSPDGLNDFDYAIQPWTRTEMNIVDGSRKRNIDYSLALNYSRKFADKHTTSALFLFKRQERARGNGFPTYREDWVARITYDYASKYFVDVNGAYNGSQKFGPDYRFDLFPSVALGWMVSNEPFMAGADWLDKLKFRGSYGLVGDDKGGGAFAYLTQWKSGGQSFLDGSKFGGTSPYVYYSEAKVGNPDLQWETAIKSNFGLELALFDNMITADFDYFEENRDNIVVPGGSRAIPDFYGISAPDANSGAVEVKGVELVLGLKHEFASGLNVSADLSYTHAKDKVIRRDDPELKPDYLKAEGYPIGQPRAAIAGDILTSWNDIYMAVPLESNQNFRRPGYRDLVDFDGNGTYNSLYDNAPYGYPSRPQHTYTLGLGAGYKGFSFTALMYGATNAMRSYNSRTFTEQTHTVYDHVLDYWTPENPDGEQTMEMWSLGSATDDPNRDRYDAAVFRIKTIELAYNFPESFVDRLGLGRLRVFINGNNLFLWTHMPDDREYNGSNVESSDWRGDYPTLKRVNFGFNLDF